MFFFCCACYTVAISSRAKNKRKIKRPTFVSHETLIIIILKNAQSTSMFLMCTIMSHSNAAAAAWGSLLLVVCVEIFFSLSLVFFYTLRNYFHLTRAQSASQPYAKILPSVILSGTLTRLIYCQRWRDNCCNLQVHLMRRQRAINGFYNIFTLFFEFNKWNSFWAMPSRVTSQQQKEPVRLKCQVM